jgi:Protein of unknown function (DUF1064)
MTKPQKSKYRNVRTNGFASKKEAKRYQELKLLEKARKLCDLETQVRYKLEVSGQLICTYIADFVYLHLDDKGGWLMTVEDVKGVRTPVYKLKAKLMKAIYGITILET